MAKSRVYFITDVHGSNRCFKKFLNAASFYKADVIILGGDITGKVMTPIVEEGDGTFRCTYQGSDLVLKSREEVDDLLEGELRVQLRSSDRSRSLSFAWTRVQRDEGHFGNHD